MDEKHGVRGTTFDSVFFTESNVRGVRVVRRIQVEISRQNSNVTEVKREMARQAQAVGCSTISNFRYGQKAHAWWEQVFAFKWDTESWHGSGDAIA